MKSFWKSRNLFSKRFLAAGGTREKFSFGKKRFFPGEKMPKTCYIRLLNQVTKIN